MISVVIPVLNGADTIGQQLQALAEQDTDVAWEVVIADNGSTDASVAVAESFDGVLPGLRVVDASRRRGPAAARNIGVEAARGEVLAFCDADDIVAPGWLAAMASASTEQDFVAGGLNFDFASLGAKLRAHDRSPAWAPCVGHFGWLKYALGANMAVSRRAFHEVGGFVEELHAGEDLDLSWRLQLAGYTLHYEPGALVHKRPRPSNRHTVRQHVNYGRHDVALFKRLRSSGMPRRPAAAQVRLYGWLAVNVWRVIAGGRGRDTWLVAFAGALGRMIGSVRYGVVYL